MPCKSTSNYQVVFDDTLPSIINIVNDTVCKSIICDGDFNIDFNVGRGLFGTLSTFMQELQVVVADILFCLPLV